MAKTVCYNSIITIIREEEKSELWGAAVGFILDLSNDRRNFFMFQMPKYQEPDFSSPLFQQAPSVRFAAAERDGVLPDHFHSTSMYPEYFKIDGTWVLAEESRMDGAVVLRPDGRLDVVEQRSVRAGDQVVIGRSEQCEEGIYLHTAAFCSDEAVAESFAFRSGRSRETAFSKDYDRLYELLEYEKEHGYTVWVMGPAFAFDADARRAMQALVEHGFVSCILAGNALATHDLEAGYLKTALGQNIYTQMPHPNGHYNHLEVINRVRRSGSIHQFLADYSVSDGIMYACDKNQVPYVLTSSIRDDGPLPEVIASAYEGQAKMREHIRKATTVICLATQLHTIAAGNMTPSFRKVDGMIRPLYLYTVDISEFVVNKLRDRGSLSAISMVTNVQDFIVNVAKGVGAL